MAWNIVVAVLLVTTPTIPAADHAPPNQPPVADAGLDQHVTAGSTVLLDATGSRDPDGHIAEYTWTIETPDGNTIEPACPSCERTRFRATDQGEYNVSLTVTDDDGTTRSDYLYVTVTPDDPPAVNVTGPRRTTTETPTTFRANVTSGSEPVRNITWTIEDTPNPVENTTIVTRQFEDTGTQSITVTVTDEIGRTTSDALQVTVQATNTTPPPPEDGNGTDPTDPPNGSDPGPIITPAPDPGNGTSPPVNPSPGDGSPNGSDGSGTLARQFDPTVTGQQLVTGDRPLEASYSVASNADSHDISHIEWIVNGNSQTTNPSIDATWTPGRHSLEAKVTYTDDSTDTATFDDGTTTVVADPAPDPILDDPDVQTTGITGSFDVRDGYGNLADVTVTVDDRNVFDAEYAPMRRLQPEHVQDHYRYENPTPNHTHTITLTATDDRGQTRTTTRTIETPPSPEIVSIGFPDEPVDSYHPRIDEDRYTATHVVKIDLNGYEPSQVTVNTEPSKPATLDLEGPRRSYNQQTDILTVETDWAGNTPGNYGVDTGLSIDNRKTRVLVSSFNVSASPPELRLTSPLEGTEDFVQEWGMVVDASQSFDPDGHAIDINWLDGAVPIGGEGWIAKFAPTDTAGVRIQDETGAIAEKLGNFLPYYIPRISEKKTTTSGPYNRTEDVIFEIRTDSYAFTKNPKRYNITLGARTNSTAVDILSVKKRQVPPNEVDGKNAIKHRLYRWVATVRVEAGALNESKNWVTLYNVKNPERIYVSEELGEVELRFSRKTQNLSLERTAYRVENDSGVQQISITDRSRYRQLVRHGWSFEKRKAVVDSVTIQNRERESYTVTRQRNFSDGSGARQFAAARSEWTYAGKETYEETETVVVSEWKRDVNTGRPTGQTRRVVSNPNAYVTQRQYRYWTTKQVTVTQEVSKEVPVTVTVEKTVKEEVCRPRVGCYIRERTITVDKTKMVERTVTVERDVTRRVQHQYWAKDAFSNEHTATGETRQVRSEPKRYHTEYLVQIPKKRTEAKTRHLVSKSVQNSREEWTDFTNVSTIMKARGIAKTDDKRIGSIEKRTKWILTREGNTTEVVEMYDDKSNVRVTYGTVTGTLVYGPNSDQEREFTVTVEMTEHATKEELVEAAKVRITDCDADTEDCDE
ncbi:PKD domain-containing protein [Halorubellus sp. PRR65]|uniref:PKD domain-containing protein n=1 Tax=Halorubellus sp. PRR65 TaxID=3098148 RepID=UPI002B2637D3|nr:PKD domain-containing protein [Halorubellus sp. PRR65]